MYQFDPIGDTVLQNMEFEQMCEQRSSIKHPASCALAIPVFLMVASGCGTEVDPNQEASEQASASSLLEARKDFQTRLIPNSFRPDGPADEPPDSVFSLVRFESNAGDLAAYVTPNPGDGVRHPAVIWAHGGFGGIGSWLWEEAPEDNDQSARAFLDAGIVTMCPSWRGENDNPGKFELFYGEVDDLMSALSYLKQLPYVDPERIYLAGHSTGGTMALLGSVSSASFRAIFSFGGAPDLQIVVSNGTGYGNTPYNYRSKEESYYRSPINFVDMIVSPTFYFEGEESAYCQDALQMEAKGKRNKVPFQVFIVKNGTHFNILHPLTRMVARKIVADNGDVCNISISDEDIELR